MRTLKILGLAFGATLLMSAVTAASASADYVTAESYPVTLTAKSTTENTKFVTTSGTINCKAVAYTSTLSGPSTTVSTSPSYSECTAFGFPATIDVNGCKYIYNIGAGTTGDADLSCEAGKSITVTAISAGTIKCTVHVGSQSDVGGTVTYSNTGAGTTREVNAGISLNGVDYSHTKGTGLGACTAGSATTGTHEGAGVVTAEKVGTNTHVGLFLS